ncbi:unnamed protein product [Mytilus edulis]|uniref:Uncharacterized protein n=1 Tax=Mytilus edulis TaxID=6550 RepID=A0A8S3TI72_MYTED|nr:unnamed protein product [Mytilus edulis]
MLPKAQDTSSFNISDPDKHHLQDFFEEIGFVVKLREDSNYAQLYTDIPRGNFYCVFLVLISPVEFEDIYPIQHVLRHRIPGDIFQDFIKVTRSNRFADIMDILTRMNALYDRPTVSIHSTLREKFCFSNPTPTIATEHKRSVTLVAVQLNALY